MTRPRLSTLLGALGLVILLGILLAPFLPQVHFTKTSMNLDSAYLKTEQRLLGVVYSTELKPSWIAESLAIPASQAEDKGRWVTVTDIHLQGYGANYLWGGVYYRNREVDSMLIDLSNELENPAKLKAYRLASAEMLLHSLQTGNPRTADKVNQYILRDLRDLY